MAPKAKAKRDYRPRATRVHGAPAALTRRVEQLGAAMRARPGSLRICPVCAYPRYVPDDATCIYGCAMPRVRLPSGSWYTCSYKTTSEAWCRMPLSSAAYESACKAVVNDIIRDTEARCDEGTLQNEQYWEHVRSEMAARTAAAVAAATPQPPDPVPAAP